MKGGKNHGSTKGGIPNKKLKKFPRILDYLETHYPEFYNLFNYLGMQGSLNPRRGGGITLLIPDKSVIAELHKTAESDNPEDATNVLLALIIRDVLRTPADWQERKNDIPNGDGNKVEVTGVKGDTVMLTNGASVKLDKDAKFLERQGKQTRGNLAVWHITGMYDHAGAKPATYEHVNELGKPKKAPEKGKKKGGFINPHGPRELKAWFTRLNERYRHWYATGADPARNPSGIAMAGFLNWLCEKRASAQCLPLCEKVACLLRFCPEVDVVLVFDSPLLQGDNDFESLVIKHVSDRGEIPYKGGDLGGAYERFMGYAWQGNAMALTQMAHVSNQLEAYVEKTLLSKANLQSLIVRLHELAGEITTTNKFKGIDGPLYPDSYFHLIQGKPDLYLAINHFVDSTFVMYRYVKGLPNKSSQASLSELDDVFKSVSATNFTDIPAEYIKVTNKALDSLKAFGAPQVAALTNFIRGAIAGSTPHSTGKGLVADPSDGDPYSLEINHSQIRVGAAEVAVLTADVVETDAECPAELIALCATAVKECGEDAVRAALEACLKGKSADEEPAEK